MSDDGMNREWVIIGLVVVLLAVAGCVGNGGQAPENGDGAGTDGNGTDEGTTDGTESSTDDGPGGGGGAGADADGADGGAGEGTEGGSTEGGTDGDSDGETDGGDGTDTRTAGEATGDTNGALAGCRAGATQTYDFTSTQGGTQTATVTVEGTEQREGTEFCRFSVSYDELEVGQGGGTSDLPGQANRTPETATVWTTEWESGELDLADGEGHAIVEVYDTEGNIIFSLDTKGESAGVLSDVTFYDEEGNEVEIPGINQTGEGRAGGV